MKRNDIGSFSAPTLFSLQRHATDSATLQRKQHLLDKTEVQSWWFTQTFLRTVRPQLTKSNHSLRQKSVSFHILCVTNIRTSEHILSGSSLYLNSNRSVTLSARLLELSHRYPVESNLSKQFQCAVRTSRTETQWPILSQIRNTVTRMVEVEQVGKGKRGPNNGLKSAKFGYGLEARNFYTNERMCSLHFKPSPQLVLWSRKIFFI